MYIASQSPTEITVEDSAVWLSWIFGTLAAIVMFFSAAMHQPYWLFGAALLVLCALIAEQRSTFTFDATERVVRWKNIKRLKAGTGSIPFGEITDIGIETPAATPSASSHRLTLITPGQTIPMAYAYSRQKDGYSQLRQQLLAFIKPGSEEPDGVTAHGIPTDLEPSLRSLLEENHKVDAIKLLQSSQHLGLSDAVKRIDSLEKSIKAETRSASAPASPSL